MQKQTNIKNYLEGPEMTQLVVKAREIKNSGKIFSDVYDAKGCQYVDLVQEGGGVLGIALVGYTYILEQAGIRFYSLGGTSAGAINALFMAGMANIGEPVSMKILDALSQKNFFDFVDGSKGVKHLIQRKVEECGGLFWNLLFNSVTIYYQLRYRLGLNPGEKLENWIDHHLREAGINSYADLKQKRTLASQLYHRENKPISKPRLAIISSEITTHTKVDFPRMAHLYWKDVEKIHPAQFVKASIAIPYFYYPFVKKDIPDAGTKSHKEWMTFAGYRGEVPPEVKFVDGGLLSNFPINIFHTKKIPSLPTFGVRLSVYREKYSSTSGVFSLGGAMISTMRQIHDYNFLLRNPDYKQLICHIDADLQYNWLNFNMSFQDQQNLLLMGARKGLAFLQNFDWKAYKSVRKKIQES